MVGTKTGIELKENLFISVFKKRPYIAWPILFIALSFIVFGNTLGHDYAWDDKIVITQNERVQDGLRGIPEIWKKHSRESLQDFAGYRPVTLTTFAVDQAIAKGSPGFGHFGNVFLYGICCTLLFFLLRSLFHERSEIFAFICTLFFLLHTTHTEVVANIKSRDEILAAIFTISALLVTITVDEKLRKSGKLDYLLFVPIFIFAMLGLLSRENGVVVFALIPFIVFWRTEEWNFKRITLLASGPIMFPVAMATIYLLSGSFPWEDVAYTMDAVRENRVLANCLETKLTFWERIGMACQLLTHYEYDFLLPHSLVYYSGYNQMEVNTWQSPFPNSFHFMPHVAAIVFMIYAAISRKWKDLSFGFWWYLISIALFLQLFFLLDDTYADRFLFLPSAGLCIFLVSIAARAFGVRFEKDAGVKEFISRGRNQIFVVFLLLFAISWGAQTINRNSIWSDDLTLFSSDMPRLENCSKAHFYLASELARRNQGEVVRDSVDNAIIEHYSKAIEISEEAYYARIDLAEYYLRTKRSSLAIPIAEKAVAKFPGSAESWFFLGKAQYLNGNIQEAHDALYKSHVLDPRPEDLNYYYVQSLLQTADTLGAFVISGYAVKKHPASPGIQEVRADVFFAKGDYEFAVIHMEESVRLNPNNANAWKKLIGMYQTIGNDAMASHFYQEAVKRGVLE